MEPIKLPNSLKSKMEFHSSFCELHTFIKDGVEFMRPYQRMVINGEVVCPRCENEKNTKAFEEQVNAEIRKTKNEADYNVLFDKSVIDDKTVLKARFSNYRVLEDEETKNKALVQELVERYKQGETFNMILQGKQGTGKSHLAYSTLWELNQEKKYSCLFISVYSMLREIKATFRYKEDKGNYRDTKFNEEYFNDLLSRVDFLVLDDLGAETGAIDTDKSATDFVQRVLYGITNTRQDKSTIITTNLNGETLFSMYDKKLISRLLRNPEYVVFKETKDKRTNKLPF